MALQVMRPQEGLRHSSGLVTTAIINTPQVLYQFPVVTAFNPVGRTARVTKIMIDANGLAGGSLQIGNALAGLFTQRIPTLSVLANLTNTYGEDEIPEWWFGETGEANITFQATALYIVQVEVEEKGA